MRQGQLAHSPAPAVCTDARDGRRLGTVRWLALLTLIPAAAPAGAQPAEGSAAWAPNDIRVSRTEAERPRSTSAHFEVAPNGDARITVELRDGGAHKIGRAHV